MNQRSTPYLLCVCFLFAVTSSGAQQFVTYPAPDSARRAADFSARVNGQAVFVCDNAVSAMTTFSFAGNDHPRASHSLGAGGTCVGGERDGIGLEIGT